MSGEVCPEDSRVLPDSTPLLVLPASCVALPEEDCPLPPSVLPEDCPFCPAALAACSCCPAVVGGAGWGTRLLIEAARTPAACARCTAASEAAAPAATLLALAGGGEVSTVLPRD